MYLPMSSSLSCEFSPDGDLFWPWTRMHFFEMWNKRWICVMATVMQQHPVIEALFWWTGTKGSWRDVGMGEERREGGRDRGWLYRQVNRRGERMYGERMRSSRGKSRRRKERRLREWKIRDEWGNNGEKNKRDKRRPVVSEALSGDAIFHFCDSSVIPTIIQSLMCRISLVSFPEKAKLGRKKKALLIQNVNTEKCNK